MPQSCRSAPAFVAPLHASQHTSETRAGIIAPVGVDELEPHRELGGIDTEETTVRALHLTPWILTALLAFSGTAYGQSLSFKAELSTAQEVTGPGPAPAPGLIVSSDAKARFDDALTEVDVKLRVDDGTNVVAAHFHCARPGQNGPIAFGLFSPGPLFFDGKKTKGILTNADFTGADCVPFIGRPVSNMAALALAMRDGLIYINVHTTDVPAGEVRGQMLEK